MDWLELVDAVNSVFNLREAGWHNKRPIPSSGQEKAVDDNDGVVFLVLRTKV